MDSRDFESLKKIQNCIDENIKTAGDFITKTEGISKTIEKMEQSSEKDEIRQYIDSIVENIKRMNKVSQEMINAFTELIK